MDRPSRQKLLETAAEVRRPAAELRGDAFIACELARLMLRSRNRDQTAQPRPLSPQALHAEKLTFGRRAGECSARHPRATAAAFLVILLAYDSVWAHPACCTRGTTAVPLFPISRGGCQASALPSTSAPLCQRGVGGTWPVRGDMR